MIRIIIILFLLISNPVLADCKYYAEADVVNDELINKKEHYTCKEKDNFFVQFLTDPKYETSLIMIVATLLENL
ncbi:hypothetical protein OAK18_01070 [Candidatus Pelagibacter sp.]|nr:hypothetical protein [Candidatus Pelagibacter sp.]